MTDHHKVSWDRYNRDQLITDVAEMLRDRGLSPDLTPERQAQRQQAACDLLAGLSVMPTLSPIAGLDLDGHSRYQNRLHGD